MTDVPNNASATSALDFDLSVADTTDAVDFQLTWPETQRALAFKLQSEIIAVVGIAVIGALALTGIPTWVRGYNDPMVWTCTILGGAVAAAIAVAAHWPGQARKRLRDKLIKQTRIQWVLGRRHVELREDGVFTSSQIFRGTHSWQAIKSVQKTSAAVFLITIENRVIFVPRRAFDSEHQAEEFFAYANAHYESNRQIAPPVAS